MVHFFGLVLDPTILCFKMFKGRMMITTAIFGRYWVCQMVPNHSLDAWGGCTVKVGPRHIIHFLGKYGEIFWVQAPFLQRKIS